MTTIVCFAGCVCCVIALHVLRPDLDPLSRRVSEYANGPYGPVMTVAFWLLGVGSLSLARALPQALRLKAAARVVPGLLGMSGVGMIVAGLFKTRGASPVTLTEIVHSRGSGFALIALITAAVLLSTGQAGESGFRGPSTALAALAVAIGVVSPLLHNSSWTGGVQRLLGLTLATWLLLTARLVRQRRLEQQ